jgi:hypothetical protein
MTAEEVISLFHSAAHDAAIDTLRNAQMLCFPGEGSLYVAGDLHNHTRNFQRFQKAADLGNNPGRHVILQELIHGGPLGASGEDRSLGLLIEALQWSAAFPGRIHFLLANHDMAQVLNIAIMKDGYDLTDRFSRYINLTFGPNAPQVHEALAAYLRALPLAAITATGIFLSHSLPAARDLASFDRTIVRRDLTPEDWARTGSIYQMIWGRNQTQEVLDRVSKMWYADLFVCGHQQQDAGSKTLGDRMLIIDSSHNHGVYLPIDLARSYTLETLAAEVVPLASVE